MFSEDPSECQDPSKRNISPWHLFAIYGLLTLCILMGILSIVSLHHLNRRQMDVEVKLSCSSCTCFDAHHSIKDKGRETSSDGDSQEENVHEDDVDDQQALISDDDSGYTVASSNRTAGVAESNQGIRSQMVLQRSSRDSDHPNSTLIWRNSEDARERISSAKGQPNHQTPEGNGTSFPTDLSNSSESSVKALDGRGLLTRLPRQARDRDQNRKQSRATGKRRIRHQKNESQSHFQGMAAIHLQAPEHMDRQYESGPMISLNASYAKDTVYRFWRKASWVRNSVDDVFHLDEETGHVTVEIEGLYMIYAQMVYHDLSGRWSFGIYVGDQEKVKCLATEQLRDLHSYHPTSHGVYQNCYTAIVLHIRKNQSVTIRCMYGSRTILTRPEFTFWGMIRLS